MIDNFEQIKSLISFNSEDEFYHLQIIKRKKEHPELGSNSYIVKTYYLNKLEELDYYKGEIICLCNFHNARAYINLNKRSFERVAFQTLGKISDQIMNKDYKSVRKCYTSACGAYAHDSDKKWVIDIDAKDLLFIKTLTNYIYDIEPIGVKELALIETKHGWHLITKPFNLQKFKEIYPDIEVHKNNPTILMIP